MKLGAFHYITKPFKVGEVVHLVDGALEMREMKKENIHLKQQAIGRYRFENIIGISEPIRQVLSLVANVAGRDSTILILGVGGPGRGTTRLQAKILRVLQKQSFTPVGRTKAVDVDVRVIAATNKDLEKEITAGRFRQDLYFRLNVIPIPLPPLRERH